MSTNGTTENGPISCRVVTPEATVFDESVSGVVVPAFDGEVGILRNHAPMVALVGLGEMRVRSGGQVSRLAVDGGFLQVKNNCVIILTTRAATADSLDPVAIAAESTRLGPQRPTELEAREAWDHASAWNRLCERLAQRDNGSS